MNQKTAENKNELRKFQIVVIEDDDGIGKLILTKLSRLGFNSKLAETGADALKIVTGAKNEILIVDYKLPDMSGKELIQQLIRKHGSTPNFFTLTGYGNEQIAADMMKLGSHEYIVKEPRFMDVLPEVLEHVCKNIINEQQLAKTTTELEKNLELLKETGEMARVGGWEINLETNKVYWTDTTKHIHEVPHDYLPTVEEAIAFFPEESGIKIKKAIEQAIQSGKEYNLELQFVTAKGNRLWVQAIGKPEIRNGKCVRLHGTFQDITQRKEAENKLKIKNAILERTEQIANIGSWEWDVKSDTVTWSEELFRIFKLDPEKGAPSYKEHPKIYTPESMKKLDDAVKECIKTGKSYQIDLEIIRGDGSNAFCTARGLAKKDNKGKVKQLFGSFQDISERKKAEERIQESEEKFRSTVESISDGFFVLESKDFKVTYFNAEAEKLLNRKADKVIGKPLFEAFPEGKGSVFEKNYTKAYKSKKTLSFETFFETKPFTNWYEVRVYPRVDSLSVFFQVITNRKKAEENLKAHNQQLNALNQQLIASEQQLRAANQQLAANEQQLRASNQQLAANEQQLRAYNQQLIAHEKELIKSKETAEQYLNIAAQIILSLDKNGKITLMNESGHRLLGYQNGELLGKNWFKTCLPKDSVKELKSVFKQIMSGKLEDVDNYESDIITKSGEIKTIFWHNNTLKDEQGKIYGTLSSGEDITESKKMHELLAASEKKYRSIMDNSSSSVFIKDLDGKYIYINRKFEEMHGISNDEIQALTDYDLFSKELADQFKRNDLEIIKTGESKNFEEVVPWKGKTKTVLSVKFPLQDKQGKTYAVCGIATDITERKKVEEALRISEENLQNTFDLSPSIIAKANLNTGYFIEANQAVTKILGYSVEEFTSTPFMELIHPEDIEVSTDEKEEQIKGKEVSSFENRYLCKDGSYKWLAWFGTKADKNGIVNAVGTDITEKKKVENELLKAKRKVEISEERFRKAQKAGHIGSWEYNLHTEEFWGSDEGKRIYNLDLKKEDFPAEEVMNIVVEEDRDKVNQAMIDLVQNNKPYDIVFEIIPKNTTNRKVIHSIAELERDESGQPFKVTGVLLDITKQKNLEKKLIEAKDKAEEADQLKSAFLANMSHEIRTPMNGILGFTNLLRDHNISIEKHKEFIDIIQKSGNRMLETVNDLIDISKIETGQVSVVMDKTDINDELKMLADLFKLEAAQKGLEFKLEKLLPNQQSIINCDRQKMISIMSNLLKNAIKYTDTGFVKTGLEQKEGCMHFYVRDSGVGVPKDRQQAIFNRFEQADIKDIRAFQGSGLGLAIVKAYVELLNGEVGVDSTVNKGSTFWVKIPLKNQIQTPQKKENSTNSANFKELQELKVLIAEDDKISSFHFTALLKNKTKQLLYSNTGRETIDLCKKHSDIDLILMDVKMPDIDGYDATKEIRKFNKDVVIIAQTAYALSGERDKALAAGCDEYISKPIDKDKLFEIISKSLEKKHE